MEDLSGYPYMKVEIKKNGRLLEPGDLGRAAAFVSDNDITDLVVISHGWNNNTSEAQGLYEGLFASVKTVTSGGAVDLGDRKLGVLGIFWPSKKFTDKDLIPGGGAASVGGDQSDDVVGERLDFLEEALDDADARETFVALRASIATLDSDPGARKLFADQVRSLLSREHATSDDGSDRFFDADAEDLFDRLKAPFLPQAPGGVMGGAAGGVMGGVMGGGGPAGGAAGLGDWFNGTKAAARRILNYATYYTMKARAGAVGAGGVSQVIAAVKEGSPATKVHLVGHSFGGRVVTAATKSLGDAEKPNPNSMSLLQAAFSHNGFAKQFHKGENGYFRSVMADSTVAGPVVVTHTQNDKANALAYPLASRLAGQDAAAVGDANDRFGAIGANGAQHTPEATSGTLLSVGTSGYAFQSGRLYNLNADDHIQDHGNVEGPEVAYAILSAISST